MWQGEVQSYGSPIFLHVYQGDRPTELRLISFGAWVCNALLASS